MREIKMKHASWMQMTLLLAVPCLAASGLEAALVPTHYHSMELYYQEDQEERFSRQFDIGPNGSLTLSNVSGDIVVRGTSGDQVQIEAVKRVERARSGADAQRQLELVEIDVSHTGTRLRVHTRYGDRRERRDRDMHVSVDYEVSVPFGTEVAVKSVSGDVEVEAVKGELEAESVSGEVSVTGADEIVLAKSVSGSVEIKSSASSRAVEIGSVSGDVEVEGLSAPELELDSVSGDVEIDDASCKRADLSTVSGDVRYSGSLAASGRYNFKSHSGDVRISISGDIGFELEAETFSGEIESDFPLTVSSIGEKQRHVSGTYGDGSALINATTFSGDVNIVQR
jgi:DUF4097 and DUF4098 domain-containing protein YvlB